MGYSAPVPGNSQHIMNKGISFISVWSIHPEGFVTLTGPACAIHNASVKKSIKGKSNREIYVNIAQIQNLQEVEHNCKISFNKLKEDYETLLEYDNHKIIK